MSEEQKEREKKGTGFFSVSVTALRDIAVKFQNSEHVAAYMVLSRHSSGHGNLANRVSVAGANAVSNKANLSNNNAKIVLNDLQVEDFVSDRDKMNDDDTDIPRFLGNKQWSGNTIRWVFNEKYKDSELVYFPNAIIDGIGTGKAAPPLYKIMSISGVHKYQRNQVCLDALMVLINFYYKHELFDCGGISPREGVYREWGVAETGITDENGYIGDVDDLSFMTIDSKSDDSKIYVMPNFRNSALPYIDNDEERKERFWYAFKDILMKKMCFVYEVLEIWENNPITDNCAEVLYPLYIFNRHKRESEPSLFKSINSSIIKHYQTIPEFINAYSTNGCDEEMKDKYIYVKQINSTAYPLSVYRLLYKPCTKDAAQWKEREKNSIEEWSEHIYWLQE